MKASKQDIHDLLAAIANDVEEIKARLGGPAGVGASGNANAISNDVVVSNGSAASNPDRIIAEINCLLEPIADVCSKLPDRIKSYYAQLLLRIPQDLREELTRDNDTRKCKGQPTVEDKIDNSTTMLISIQYDTLPKGQSARGQGSSGMPALGKGRNICTRKICKVGNYSTASICVVVDATIPLKATYEPVL